VKKHAPKIKFSTRSAYGVFPPGKANARLRACKSVHWAAVPAGSIGLRFHPDAAEDGARDGPSPVSAPPDMNLSEYVLLAASSLFVIVNPLATVPAFITMTPHDTPEQRIRMARLACGLMAGILLAFAIGGSWIFKILGITMPAFQIAASIVLLLVSLDMLRAQRSRLQQTREETEAGAEKTDIAVTPLAVPMLAGPGAISTAILLQNQARDFAQHAALCGCILGVSLASYLILRVSARGARWLNPIAMNVTIRIMGLLLAAVAIQFMVNAINILRIGTPAPPAM
jgi:multiple antibiotic resistance protein